MLRGLRLLGPQTDDTWHAPAGAEQSRGTLTAAVSWVGDRLNGRLGGRVLDRLCLDVDGAVCAWVTANSAEHGLVRAVIEQEAAGDADDPFADAGHAHAGRFPDLPGEVGYQTLRAGRGEAQGPARTPVLAVPDVAARALIDALDESGVQVGSCITLWQAMVKAWTSTPGSSSERVVADANPAVTAVVLCTPGDRVVWAWGRSDAPVAAGAFRMRAAPGSGAELPLLEDPSGPSEASTSGFGGRLAAEWLAWGVQLGVAPSRVVWVGPVESHPGLGAGELAAALRRAAAGATVDVIDDDDPIGLTLRRLAERIDAGRDRPAPDDHLVGLSNRPGRVHRGMYRWLAIVLLAASGAIAALAHEFWNQASASNATLAQVRANQRELFEAEAPDLVNDPAPFAIKTLQDRVAQARGPATVQIPQAKPVVHELETLAFVLGNPDYELQEIDVGPLSITFRVKVDDTKAYEQLQQSLLGIGGSIINWTPLNYRQQGGRVEVTGNGTWPQRGRAPGGGS